MEKLRFLVPLSSACKRSFAGFTTVLLDVKSLVEQVGEANRLLKANGFRVMLVFVMYYIYVTSGSSLLIESTDSMMLHACVVEHANIQRAACVARILIECAQCIV